MEVASEKSVTITRKNDLVARAEFGASVDMYRCSFQRCTEDQNIKDTRELYACKNAVIGIVGSKGGCLSFSDKSVSVMIPEGALSKSTLVHCYRYVGQAVNGENTDFSSHKLIQYSPRFNFGPDGTIFQKPITVRFRHSISQKDWSNGHTEKLKVHYASKCGSRWKRDDTEQCRLDGEWMEITLDHFGAKPERENWRQQETSSRIIVYCGNSRKGIVADKTNFDELHNTIANRFKLSGDFQLQTKDNDGERVDLDCNEDLEDNSEFVHTIWVIETPATAPNTKVVVHHGNTTKQLHVEDKTSFEKLHNAIVRRFQLEGDYTYQIENEDGKRFDIDNDADLKENSEFLGNIWAIPNPDAAIKCAQERETRESVTLKHGLETFTHSLIEPLDTNSAIVVKKYKEMQEKVGIAALSSSLEIVGDCLEIAYYATTDDHSMQKYVQNMQFGVAQLCRECNTTMVGMQTKAEDAINEMQCGFGYLLEGFEDFGIKRLESVAEIAGKIHKDTQCLNTALESTISLAVRKGIDEVSRRQADGKGDGAIKMREDELNEEILDMIRKQNETREELEQAKSKIAVLSPQEDEAVQAETEYLNADTGFGFGIKKMFTLGFYQGSTQLAEQQKRLTREAKEDQEKDRERLKELRTAGAEANRALAKTAAMLAQLKANPNQMTSVAIRGAKAGLKGLVTILLNIKVFWADCQKAFQSIGQTKAIDQLKMFPKECLEERKKYWQSKGFKIEAFNNIVKFVAIQQMCIDFQRTLRQVLENIDRCIRDNPSREQAMKKIPKLVDNFDRKTKQKQPETTALVH